MPFVVKNWYVRWFGGWSDLLCRWVVLVLLIFVEAWLLVLFCRFWIAGWSWKMYYVVLQ